MGTDFEKDALRERLERELSQTAFREELKLRVLQRAKRSFWEREVRIPVSAAVIVCLLLSAVVGVWVQRSVHHAPVPPSAERERGDGANGSAGPEERTFVVLNGGVYNARSFGEGGRK
ncbi:hypothetical protein [Paenibacillus sp. MBLB4367]|uniref:hypothetical protein n=1 Tax=Paenibacillus sp. MBLB4367 TaxID=3384767 RepID=UPI0039081B33